MRTRRVRRPYRQRRRHVWRETVTSAFYCADHAWFLAAEAAAIGYETELAEYAAEHPRPTLKGFMLALANSDRDDQHDQADEPEEGQHDDAA